jgi:hypothetical protein
MLRGLKVAVLGLYGGKKHGLSRDSVEQMKHGASDQPRSMGPLREVSGVACLLALLLTSRTVSAGNEDEFFVGNDAALVGGAVVASTHDGGSVWYNPAGLSIVRRDQLDATTSVYSLRLYRADAFLRSTGGKRTSLDVTDFVSVPVHVSYVRPLGRGVSLGLGYFQPRGSKLLVHLRQTTEDGDVATNLSVSGTVITSEIGLGAAVGFTAAPGLRVGVGAMLRWDSLTQSVDFFASSAVAGVSAQLFQSANLREQNLFGVEPTAGIQWDVTPRVTLGLNVRGPRLSLYNRGNQTASTGVAIADAGQVGLQTESDDHSVSKSSVALVRGGRYFAGLAYRFEKVGIHFDADVQPGWHAQESGVSRSFTWNARVGGSYELAKVITLGAGLFTDRAAADADESSLIIGSGNFYGGSLGVRLSNEHLLAATEPVDSLVFTSVFALRYAQADARSESIIVDSTTPDLAGSLQYGESKLVVRELALYVGGGLSF